MVMHTRKSWRNLTKNTKVDVKYAKVKQPMRETLQTQARGGYAASFDAD